MALLEFLDDKPVRPPIQIFATDLSDQTALEKARAGVYPESIEADVSPERLRRFFQREDHVYRIDKAIRDMCVFARQNVAADPPFSHLDLISCRNVLIYLATPLQKRVLPTFHYALNRPGFLVLGRAETVGEHTDLFELVDRAHKIYAKKATATAARPRTSRPTDYKAASRWPPADGRPARRHAARLPAGGRPRSCSAATPRPACWSTRTSTSSSSAGGPARTSSRRRASRPPTCSRWPARACSSSCATPSIEARKQRADRSAATTCACATDGERPGGRRLR